jgi:hypothetical protein
MLLEGLVFRLQHFRSDDWELGEECFVFYKDKKLIRTLPRQIDTAKVDSGTVVTLAP